jgi:hypothetical protein
MNKRPKIRRRWGNLKPITRIKPNGKIYSRKKRNSFSDRDLSKVPAELPDNQRFTY